jgi:hypothetical protein
MCSAQPVSPAAVRLAAGRFFEGVPGRHDAYLLKLKKVFEPGVRAPDVTPIPSTTPMAQSGKTTHIRSW